MVQTDICSAQHIVPSTCIVHIQLIIKFYEEIVLPNFWMPHNLGAVISLATMGSIMALLSYFIVTSGYTGMHITVHWFIVYQRHMALVLVYQTATIFTLMDNEGQLLEGYSSGKWRPL